MDTVAFLAFLTTIFSCGSMVYKIYLHQKIPVRHPVNRPNLLFPTAAIVLIFFPILKKGKTQEEVKLIKKANVALLGFYGGIFLGSLLAILDFYLKGKL